MEKPTIEEPKAEPKTEVSAEDQAKAILEELKSRGIDSPEKIENMAKASSEAGNLARMLGELRQQNANLERQIQNMNQPHKTDYDNDYGESIDLRQVVRNELRGFWNDEIVKPQAEMTNRVYSELAAIQSDEDYPLVNQMWESHWQNPSTQHRVSTGQSSPKTEYDRLVRTYYRQSFKKTYDALQGVVESRAKAPHVETGDQTHVSMPTADDETREKVKNITKNSQGSDSDIEALVKAMLPSDDAIFKR